MTRKELLTKRMKSLGLSYQDIANITGIPRGTVYDLINKNDDRMERIINALELYLIIEEK
jgi:predicted DNA-binding protein YlxM (UPF0122 family)